jgi:hypothetical protein
MTATTPIISLVPSSVRTALKDPHWLTAMQDEHNALLRNRTWTLVDRPPGARVISAKWVFKHKLNANGSLERYKARWVVRCFNQCLDVDFGETFSPIVKRATIRTVLTIIASRQWPAHQLDVSNAFLHGNLNERVYCQRPTGFTDPQRPDTICLLSRSLYGLRQALRAWFTKFSEFITSIGFSQSRLDSSLFVLHSSTGTAYLLLYVDDMVLSASSTGLLEHIVAKLKSAFAVKDMGNLKDISSASTSAHREWLLPLPGQLCR